jgi:hypothetical protein
MECSRTTSPNKKNPIKIHQAHTIVLLQFQCQKTKAKQKDLMLTLPESFRVKRKRCQSNIRHINLNKMQLIKTSSSVKIVENPSSQKKPTDFYKKTHKRIRR